MSLLERIYHFHEELKKNRFPNTTTLIEQFEVSLPTARRDIAYMRDRLLAPMAFDRDRNGFYYTENDFTLPFERTPKILFLLGMLNKIAEEAGLGSMPEVKTLEKRISEHISPGYSALVDAIYCEWVEIESPQPAIFEEILAAIFKKKVLRINYRSAQAEESLREIEPLRLVCYQGRWYLLAFCHLRHDIRLFHISRISSAQMEKTTFQRNSEDNFNSHLHSAFGIFKGTVRYEAKILFTSTAAELVRHQRWHKDQTVEEVKEGVLMRLPVSHHIEIMTKILQYGSMARVIAPVELRRKVEEEAGKITALYSTPEPELTEKSGVTFTSSF